MKIMHFHYGRDGGAERFFVQFANALARRDIAQTAIIRPERAWRAALDPHISVMEGVWRRRTLGRWFFERRRRKLIDAFAPDVMMSWLTRGARSMPDLPQYLRVARMGDYPGQLGYFRNVDIIVCNTPDIVRHVQSMGWSKRCETISNFTETGETVPVRRETLQTPEKAFVIAAAGRFVQRKGFGTLIAALPRLPAAILWLIGEGEEKQALEGQAAKLGVADRIRWAGWQSDPKSFFAAADAVVMPSTHEPLGNVILEAWAANAPVVASRSEGPLWLIKQGENGLLFDIGDATGLADALSTLQAEPDYGRKLVAGGQTTLAATFSEDAVCSDYLELFREGLREKSRQSRS
jgi:glycosyltransferase involved in cell wall biosynthesis